jgi:hypothetical protein
VVTVLGRPGRGATQVEIPPRLNWATQIFTVIYYSAYFPNISIRMTWIFFGVLACREKNLIAHVSKMLKSWASSDMLPFSLRKKKRIAIWHMNRPSFQRNYRFRPTTSGNRSG